jgi:hypothetical protein
VLRGNGDGTFQAPIDFLAGFHGTEPSTVITGDFNGDGKPDLATTNFDANDVSVLLNTTPTPVHAAPATTATSLSADVKSAVFGQPVTLTARVTSPGGTPTGTVTFFDGTTVLGEVALDPNGQASITLPLGTGTHSLHASFAGIAPFTASTSAAVSETVAKAATTTAVAAETRSVPGMGEIALFSATVAPVAPGAGVPTGTVTFFDGTTVLGTAVVDANGQASLFIEGLSKGRHSVTASYSGDGNFQVSSSTPLVFTVS